MFWILSPCSQLAFLIPLPTFSPNKPPSLLQWLLTPLPVSLLASWRFVQAHLLQMLSAASCKRLL